MSSKPVGLYGDSLSQKSKTKTRRTLLTLTYFFSASVTQLFPSVDMLKYTNWCFFFLFIYFIP